MNKIDGIGKSQLSTAYNFNALYKNSPIKINRTKSIFFFFPYIIFPTIIQLIKFKFITYKMRDNRGRFKKVDKKGILICLVIPSIENIYALLFIILLPWITICFKWQILKKLLNFMENLMKFNDTEKGEIKKNGYFLLKTLLNRY